MKAQVGSILEGLQELRKIPSINESSSDWRDDFISKDSYQNTKEFQALLKKNWKLVNDNEELWKIYRKNEDTIKREGVLKPRAEWDTHDELESMIGHRVYKPDEKLDKLKEENKELMKKIKENDHELTEVRDKMDDIKKRAREVEKKDHKFTKPKKATKSDYKGFDMADTGVSYYNDLLEKGRGYVAEMSPKEYILRCAFEIFSGTIESTINGVEDSNAKKYAAKMKSGEKFHMPYLNFRESQQEGRHRAIAAYLNGYKLIPVFIVGA